MEIQPQKLNAPRLTTAPVAQWAAPDSGDVYQRTFTSTYLYDKYRPQDATCLSELRVAGSLTPSELRCLEDVPSLSADGLTRTHIHYQGAATFAKACQAKGWEQHADGSPIADAVVIGAGPGGLATSYQLAQKGARTVVLEGGYAASAFSDAGAAGVHSMRTDRLLTSLVRTGFALEDLSTVMGLPASLGPIVAHTSKAREMLFEQTRHRIQGLPEGIESTDRYQPAARAELFEHFQQIANYLAQDCPNSFLLERAPVQTVEHKDGLFRVSVEGGPTVWARKLVMATGLVLPGGANARSLPVFERLLEKHPESYLSLDKDSDLADKAPQMLEKRQWIVSDRLLGRPQVKLALHELPGQARVAVVGSGESAIKAALEVLAQNPTLKVDLFTKQALEAAQVQVPGENFHPVVLEQGMRDAEYGKDSLERFRKFDTPVTPRSLIEALDLVRSGRLRIHEMGAYFDETTVAIEPDGQQASRIRIIDPKVSQNLQAQSQEWAASGLRQEVVPEVSNVQMIISACGYDRKSLELTTLAQQLEQQGLLESKDLYFNTAGSIQSAAEGAIPGMAVKGRHVAEALVKDLPARPLPPQAERPERLGADWANGYSRESFEGFVRYRGLAPNWVESQGGPQDAPEFHFPDPERFLRQLAQRPPEQLSPSEKITLQRAHQLRLRMGNPEI